MRALIMGFAALLCVGAEATVLRGVALRGIVPNLSLILVVSYASLRGSQGGRCLGLFIGLVQDILFFSTVGFYGLLYYLIGFFSGFFCRDFNRGSYPLLLGVIAGADFLYGVINYIFLCLFKGDLHIGYYLLHRILPELCYTALAALPLCGLTALLNAGIERLTGLLHRRSAYHEGP